MGNIINLREKILNSNDIKSEIVYVDVWDTKVKVMSLTSKKRSQIISDAMTDKGKMDFEKIYPDLVIASTYDPETGALIFEASDRDLLNQKNGGALEKIAQVAMRLSGLSASEEEKAKKNS